MLKQRETIKHLYKTFMGWCRRVIVIVCNERWNIYLVIERIQDYDYRIIFNFRMDQNLTIKCHHPAPYIIDLLLSSKLKYIFSNKTYKIIGFLDGRHI